MTATTGLPADSVINDWAFQTVGAATLLDYQNACLVVSEFYRAVQANTHEVGEYISDQINRAATHELQAWTITSGPLGSPDYTEAWLGPVTANSNSGLPTEVAAVLSFHADLTGVLEESGATRPRARRRGRVFIGPLEVSAVAATAVPYPLSATFTETLRQAAVKLYDDANGLGLAWCVWSRTDETLRPVVGGWTDNAPDTQRRRGMAASIRTAWIP